MPDWDEDKRTANLAKHGVDFALAERFDWTTANPVVDDRHDYGEVREVADGLIGDELYHMVFTRREGRIRIISLRRANRKEMRRWLM